MKLYTDNPSNEYVFELARRLMCDITDKAGDISEDELYLRYSDGMLSLVKGSLTLTGELEGKSREGAAR